MNILIVGYGNIGSRLYKEYNVLGPEIYDPFKGFSAKTKDRYDIAFIAVDTPMLQDGSCDLSQVKQAIAETEANVIVLRSTVPPTTTQNLIKETGKRIVFSPEFYGTTQHCDMNAFDFDFTILGGDKTDCGYIINALQSVYNAKHRFCITDSTTAELAKYMENAMLATKVSMCVQFFQIAKKFGVEYSELREIVLQDKRIGRPHTFVYAEHPYWESHCFDKDLRALTKFSDAPLIQAVIDYNEICKEKSNGTTKT